MTDHLGNERLMYVLFRLGAEEYGLPIARVVSIIRYEEPTPVPQAPDGVDGVINLRGQVIPVLDVGRRLLSRPLEVTLASRVIVVESDIGALGLAVDAVSEVTHISAELVRPVPEAVLSAATHDAFEGIADLGERIVILLDPERALPKPVFAAATAQGSDGDA